MKTAFQVKSFVFTDKAKASKCFEIIPLKSVF